MKLKFFLPVFLIITYILTYNVFAVSLFDLKQQINDKTQTLQEINQQILKTQQDLQETEGKSKTLKKEIQNTDSGIQQLNLNIRASGINIDKLKLEVGSLQYEILDVKDKINSKKQAVAALLKELQKKDNETALYTILKNKSLAESFSEVQNLVNLNNKLSSDVSELTNFGEELSGKLQMTSNKKSEIELENKNLKNRKVIVNNQKVEKENLLAQTKNQERSYQKLISDLESQQAAIAEEIELLESELRLTIDPNLLPTSRPGVLAMPTQGKFTQPYGATNFARYAYKGQWHNGIDIAAPIGAPVFAAESGKILEVWNQDNYCYKGAYGKFIVIEHKNNLTTLYAHLSLQTVKKGDEVKRGDLIGYIGSTGYATGPHLHFTVYASQTFRIGPSKVNCGPVMPYGGDLDPKQYLNL